VNLKVRAVGLLMRTKIDERRSSYGRPPLFRTGVMALICCVVSACGCGGHERQPETHSISPPSDSVLSLTSTFGSAATNREVGILDLGTQEARPHLREGWSNDEGNRTGWTGVWGTGNRSVVSFFVGSPREIDLKLRCWALPVTTLGPQLMTVTVNHGSAGTLTIGSKRGGLYRMRIPEALLKAGRNTLTFEYSWSARPIDVLQDSGDKRQLSVMFDEIVFDGLASAEPPELAGNGSNEHIRIPPRSALSYFSKVPSRASLWLGSVISEQTRREDRCDLEIWIETESGTQLTNVVQPDAARLGPVRLPFGSDREEIVGIRFSTRAAKDGGNCRAALKIFEPHIVSATNPGVARHPDESDRGSPWAEAGRPPNILVYLIDCLRADHLGVYGYTRGVSPNIDRFAEGAVVFERAMSAASWTRPAVASLLTGLSPQSHGTRGDRDALSDEVPLVQEMLRIRGFSTVAVVTNGVVSTKFGFGRGFDDFRFLPEQHKTNPQIHQLSDRVNEEIIEWLEGRDMSKPFFMYVHSTDPHAPYLPRSPFRERFAADVDPAIGLHPAVEALTQGNTVAGPGVRQGLIDLYDGEIAYNDDQFGRLMHWFESNGLYDDTLIVLTADHGEEFEDHGRWQHGLTLYQEQLHVPLVVKLPASLNAGQKRAELVSLIDVAPTLLEAVGVDLPATTSGRSLRPWRNQGGLAPLSRPAFADLAREPQWRAVNTVILGDTKLILNHTYDRPRPSRELYDLVTDPVEEHNLETAGSIISGFLETLFRQAAAEERHVAPTAELSAEDEEKLRALGYLE